MDVEIMSPDDIADGTLAQGGTSGSNGVAQKVAETLVPTEYISDLFNPNSSLTDFFNAAFYAAIAFGAILAVLRLGYAGFMYMTTDVWGKKDTARTMIQEAVLGLLLLLAVWLILFQINPDILNLNILRSVPSDAASAQQQSSTPQLPQSN